MADVVVRGVRFHVQQLGPPEREKKAPEARPTVIFLHGLVMDNLSSYYFTVANRVAEFAEVLLYDLRGHGRSERPREGYGLGEMVADLADLLASCGVKGPLHLVGNSFGGLLALAFAIAHPERVAGLVLIDAHVSNDRWGAEMAATLGVQGQARDEMIVKHFSNWLGRHSARKRTRLAERAEALVYGTSLLADLETSPPISEEALAALKAPVLCLYGEHSDVLERGEWVAARLPNVELRVLPGCSHSVLWEATTTVRDAIIEWVRRDTERSDR